MSIWTFRLENSFFQIERDSSDFRKIPTGLCDFPNLFFLDREKPLENLDLIKTFENFLTS